jgi:SAM-dependent methyltransferase
MSYYQHEDINNAIVGLFAEAKNNDNKAGTVLDVGCGRGRLGLEIETLGFRVTGIDDSSVACETARTRLSEVIELNLMDFAKVAKMLGERRFDWLMMADVLEHLPYPEKALEFYKQYLAAGGRLMVSLPNAVVWDNRLRIMLGRFDYRDSGTMDRTHLRFFTFRSARELVENAGFTPLRRTLEPGIVRAFLPLVKKLVAGKDSPSGILESPSYQFYKNYILPVEQALASILPGLFAFRTVMTAKLTRP